MKYILGILFFLGCAAAQASAQNLRTITMRDGSQIQGRVISLQNGHYVVESPSLGKVDLKEADVVSIGASDAAKHSNANTGAADHTTAIQNTANRILSDPDLMADIQELAADPQFTAIIADPAFMSAIQSQNIQALENNPQTQKLMSNPKMQALLRKIMAGQ